jgi:hypothetical protein
MLKQLLQSLENNKPLEDILRERLSLKDKDILLLQKENSILSGRLQLSLACICESPENISSNTSNINQTSSNSTGSCKIPPCAVSKPNSLRVESDAYNEAGIYYI